MIQKQGNWMPYKLKPRDVERRFFTCWFKDNRRKVFLHQIVIEMRSGYSMTTPRRKNTTLSPVNRCHRPQHQHGRTFIVRRSCSVSGGTKRVFTISYWNLTIPLWVIGYNWFVWAVREKRSEYEQWHDKVILLHDKLSLMSLKPHVVKKYLETLKWDVLPHLPYSPDITPSDYWSFRRNSKSSVHFFRRNWKLAPKLDRLQRWVIFSRWNSERWEKVVGSDGQYFNWSVHSFCFEINAFLNTKKRTELICTPNII